MHNSGWAKPFSGGQYDPPRKIPVYISLILNILKVTIYNYVSRYINWLRINHPGEDHEGFL